MVSWLFDIEKATRFRMGVAMRKARECALPGGAEATKNGDDWIVRRTAACGRTVYLGTI